MNSSNENYTKLATRFSTPVPTHLYNVFLERLPPQVGLSLPRVWRVGKQPPDIAEA